MQQPMSINLVDIIKPTIFAFFNKKKELTN
jgi:hypothetical protein